MWLFHFVFSVDDASLSVSCDDRHIVIDHDHPPRPDLTLYNVNPTSSEIGSPGVWNGRTTVAAGNCKQMPRMKIWSLVSITTQPSFPFDLRPWPGPLEAYHMYTTVLWTDINVTSQERSNVNIKNFVVACPSTKSVKYVVHVDIYQVRVPGMYSYGGFSSRSPRCIANILHIYIIYYTSYTYSPEYVLLSPDVERPPSRLLAHTGARYEVSDVREIYGAGTRNSACSVSYTHLTLPTKA